MKKININTILLIASILFSAGVYTTKIRGNSEEIGQIKQEYVRKDVLKVELERVNENLDRIYSELKELNGGN